jgi:RNA polymerase sigma-70 factor (ECF subfamily)
VLACSGLARDDNRQNCTTSGLRNSSAIAHAKKTVRDLSPDPPVSEGLSTEGKSSMSRRPSDTEILVERAQHGDEAASQELLVRFQDRLLRMVAVRLDRRLTARVDPADVVQEALLDAAQNLAEYLRTTPLPYYPWLRQFAWQRLSKLHRHHLGTQRRDAGREESWDGALPDQSAALLARRLLATNGTSPSRQAMRSELRERVQAALAKLSDRDREVLVLRHLEQMTTPEIAATLAISEAAVKKRHVRALERLRELWSAENPDEME